MKLIDLDVRAKAAPTTGATAADPADDVTNSILLLESTIKEVPERKGELEGKTAGFLKFTEKELQKLPMKFRKHFKINQYYVSARKRVRGKNSCSIEIRYRHERDGYNISASGRTVDEAKARFIEKVNIIERNGGQMPKVPNNFHEFSMYYFENFKKRKVGKKTYSNDLSRYNKYIKPNFEHFSISAITPLMCQNLIDDIDNQNFGKTAEEVRSLLNQTFQMAINHGIIKNNPLAIVFHAPHERKHGKALSLEEEKRLLSETAGTPYQLMFAVALYTGMRPNEYKTARIEGDFIVAVNSKRHNKKVEYKKIPVTPMLQPYLKDLTELNFSSLYTIRSKFNSILPGHRLYDLRTTFYTRCRTCGVADAARDEFVGHSSGKLSDTYTDLPDNYLLKEGKKLKY